VESLTIAAQGGRPGAVEAGDSRMKSFRKRTAGHPSRAPARNRIMAHNERIGALDLFEGMPFDSKPRSMRIVCAIQNLRAAHVKDDLAVLLRKLFHS